MYDYKVLIVGCGGICKAWINSINTLDGIEIVGLMDIAIDHAKNIRKHFELSCPVFDQLDEAIDTVGPDVVIDTTIPNIHHQVTIKSLSKGCHVFGEKPLSDNIEDALAMVKASEVHDKSYFVMQNRRYNNQIRTFRKAIKDRVIGELGYISAEFYLGPKFGGFRDAMASPLILDMAIHTFDQARFISGCDPISVYCHEFNPIGSWYHGDASACCIFEMSNGVVFSYNGSWCAQGKQTSWEANWQARGSKGTASWDGFNNPTSDIPLYDKEHAFLPKELPEQTLDYGLNDKEGHLGCIEAMFQALNEGRDAETDCKDNIKSLGMVMAAIKSSKEGRKVLISEILDN